MDVYFMIDIASASGIMILVIVANIGTFQTKKHLPILPQYNLNVGEQKLFGCFDSQEGYKEIWR